jgi:membrane associated rhomboid family serine protease
MLSPPWLLFAAGVLGVIVFATLGPVGWRPHLFANPDLERCAAFAVLGFAAKLALPRKDHLTLPAVLLLAIGLEAAQQLIPGRDARLQDGLVKAFGALAGVQLGQVFFSLRRAARRWAVRWRQRQVADPNRAPS